MSKWDEHDFGLSDQEMQQIRYMEVLKRRKVHQSSKKVQRFSDKLSVEAQIAMQLALEDTQALIEMRKSEENSSTSNGHQGNETDNSAKDTAAAKESSSGIRASPVKPAAKLTKKPKRLCDVYQKRQSVKMDRDITNENYTESDQKKRSLDGSKVEAAMEIVEIINYDEPEAEVDVDVIEEIAQQNSVEKCVVWMEATDTESPLYAAGDPPVDYKDFGADEDREIS